MVCSFDVKDGKLVNVRYDGGDFDCYNKQLTSLKGCPEKVGGGFDCFENHLTSLEGCPQEVEGHFCCSDNQLTSLEGCPKKIHEVFLGAKGSGVVEQMFNCSGNQLTSIKGCPQDIGMFDCSYNYDLEDISDLPSSCEFIFIHKCHKITKFPVKIGKRLVFEDPTEEVRQRIKENSHYEVIKESKNSITVQQINIGAQLLDEL